MEHKEKRQDASIPVEHASRDRRRERWNAKEFVHRMRYLGLSFAYGGA